MSHDVVDDYRWGSFRNLIVCKELHPNKKLQAKIKKMQAKVKLELSLSDSLNQKNLLRFYHPKGLKAVNPAKYNYANGLSKEINIERRLKGKSTSLFSENGNKSTQSDYKTNAPELNHKSTDTNRIKITNPDANSGDK